MRFECTGALRWERYRVATYKQWMNINDSNNTYTRIS